MNFPLCYFLLKYEPHIKDIELFDKEQKIVQLPFSPCSQSSMSRDNFFYGAQNYYILQNWMMPLYTEIDQLRPSSLSKHKTNLYFKEVVTIEEASSL